MPSRDPARLKSLTLRLPFGLGEAEWESDPSERRAAWALYVELSTRIAVQPLDLDDGLVREALSSLHSLFATTRQVLREAGPDVMTRSTSVGRIVINVLIKGVAPFLTKWHPTLAAWESERPTGRSPRAHERLWHDEPRLRGELEALRRELETYADALGAIAGVSWRDA